MSEVERVLAAHSVDLSGLRRDRETVVGYWMACTCGFEWSPVRNGPDRHQPHVAEQIEALISERERAAQAEAWDEGYTCAMDDDPRALSANPYRIAQDAPESAPTAPLTASGVQSGLGDGESWYETPDDAIYPDVLTGRIEGLEGLS